MHLYLYFVFIVKTKLVSINFENYTMILRG